MTAGLEIRGLLVAEGPSDSALATHLRALCIEAGADESVCRCPDLGALHPPPGHTLRRMIPAALALHPDTNLLFVHRDADSVDAGPRRQAIDDAVAGVRGAPLHVCVVPVQELEAWLLLDDAAIRRVAGNPPGTTALDLPSPRRVEELARPKEVLDTIIGRAQAEIGKRRRLPTPDVRRRLVEQLRLDGPIRGAPSFQRLVRDLDEVVGRLRSRGSS